MTCGIYCLYFECADFQYYIGESTNIEIRYKRHIAELIRNNHVNSDLQAGFAQYGTPSIEIIEELICTDITLIQLREIYWVEKFNSFKEGMNRTIGGEGCSYGDVHPSSIYSNDVYKNILLLLANTDLSIVQVANKLNVSKHIVSNISVGCSATFLANDFPEEYIRMQSKVGTRNKGPKRSVTRLLSPEGIIYEVDTLLPFSIEHQLDLSGIYKLIKGKYKQLKGWTLA